jgi:hypothetical protein
MPATFTATPLKRAPNHAGQDRPVAPFLDSRDKLSHGPPELRQAYAPLVMDGVGVSDDETFIIGSKSLLARCAAPMKSLLRLRFSLFSRSGNPEGFEPQRGMAAICAEETVGVALSCSSVRTPGGATRPFNDMKSRAHPVNKIAKAKRLGLRLAPPQKLYLKPANGPYIHCW